MIACATVIEEMRSWLPAGISSEVFDFGLRPPPGKAEGGSPGAKVRIEASSNTEVLLLGYGLCSLAVVGLQPRNAHVVIPRVDDCIAIFLGSCNAYKEQAKKEPGTYYLTKGWIEVGDTPFEEHKRLIEKSGEARAKRMTQLLLKGSPATGVHQYRAL